MQTKHEKGRKGEQMAWEFFRSKGFELERKNLRIGHREIDLIVRKAELMVFVEVKLRSTDYFGMPESMISKRQERNIVEASDQYLKHIGWEGEVRFDVIAVVANKREKRLLHIEDAFWPFCTD